MPFRLRLTATIALVLLALSTAAVPAFGVEPEGGDLNVFYGYATKIVRGAVPYRDVKLEYPPGALAAIVTPALGSPSKHTYAARFTWAMLALLAAAILLLAQRPRAAFVVALAPLLLGPLAVKRFDVLPMLLTLIALELALRRRYGWSGAALGLGTAVKLYPVLLLPLLLVAAGRRALYGFVVACAAVVLPFFVLSPHGVIASVHEQVGRHLQIETPLASLALLAHSFGIVSVGVLPEAHTYGLGGSSGLALALLTTVLFLAALIAIWRRAPELVRSREGLVLAWTATLCTAVVFGRVLSPQYLLWLLPFVPLVGLRATALFVAALVLTNVWYPVPYLDVVLHMERGDIVLLVVRNLVLIALLALLLVRVEPRLQRLRPVRR
ncbi:MAG: glycosyltransferase 87 family protein [Gaiellaceae bacterium]